MPQLREAARLLEANPGVSATISGYTDNIGDAAMNLKLSQERATSVMKALEGMGVPASRLDATGYGEEHPVADNATASGRALNRRTTMDVTQQ
jgi:outer membrane protein OmpA-like peptidoglycan-associated protein